jgi:hypothetical protein
MEPQPKKNRGWSAEEYGALAAFDGDWRDLWWNQDFLELMAVRWRLSDVRSVLDVPIRSALQLRTSRSRRRQARR